MRNFQLIVRCDRGYGGLGGTSTRGDCIVIDLKSDNGPDAYVESRKHLLRDPSRWTTSTLDLSGHPRVNVYVNREDNSEFPHGVLLASSEGVQEAWIVERKDEMPLDDLRREFEDAKTLKKQEAIEADPEYIEYLRLHAKFKADREAKPSDMIVLGRTTFSQASADDD